jgi:hypothetical protein
MNIAGRAAAWEGVSRKLWARAPLSTILEELIIELSKGDGRTLSAHG